MWVLFCWLNNSWLVYILTFTALTSQSKRNQSAAISDFLKVIDKACTSLNPGQRAHLIKSTSSLWVVSVSVCSISWLPNLSKTWEKHSQPASQCDAHASDSFQDFSVSLQVNSLKSYLSWINTNDLSHNNRTQPQRSREVSHKEFTHPFSHDSTHNV